MEPGARLLSQRWLGKFKQPDRWISCLTAARLQRIRELAREIRTVR